MLNNIVDTDVELLIVAGCGYIMWRKKNPGFYFSGTRCQHLLHIKLEIVHTMFSPPL